jgi:hypothetical protein
VESICAYNVVGHEGAFSAAIGLATAQLTVVQKFPSVYNVNIVNIIDASGLEAEPGLS